MTDKKTLRKQCLEARNAIPEAEKAQADKAIQAKLLELKEYRESSLILTYVSVGSETATEGIIFDALAGGKRVAVPYVDGRSMSFRFIRSLSDLAEGSFGIPASKLNEEVPDFSSCLCVTPALCTDVSFHRLGYGGGYYDRFFEKQNDIFRAVLCPERFVFESIPSAPHDITAHCIITEITIRRCY